ncbi:MAG TPA: hypothetical protein VET87_19710 [Rubrivivax sp.]|nr:hypothetical protein [Rubrivivax sp.]
MLISGLLFPGGPRSRLIKAWRAGAFDLVISDFVLDKLARTWQHLVPKLNVKPGDLADFLDTIGLRAGLLHIAPGFSSKESNHEQRHELPWLHRPRRIRPA